MWARWTLVLPLCLAACSQSPEAKQADLIRGETSSNVAALKDQANAQAKPLEEQAKALRHNAKQVGGFDGRRLTVQAEALEEQAKLFRQQADLQAEAISEAAHARIKALESR